MSYERLCEKLCAELSTPCLMRLANAKYADEIERDVARVELGRRGEPLQQVLVLTGVDG